MPPFWEVFECKMVMFIIKIMFDELDLFWLIERNNFHTVRAPSKKWVWMLVVSPTELWLRVWICEDQHYKLQMCTWWWHDMKWHFLHLIFTRANVIENDLKMCHREKTTHLTLITVLLYDLSPLEGIHLINTENT